MYKLVIETLGIPEEDLNLLLDSLGLYHILYKLTPVIVLTPSIYPKHDHIVNFEFNFTLYNSLFELNAIPTDTLKYHLTKDLLLSYLDLYKLFKTSLRDFIKEELNSCTKVSEGDNGLLYFEYKP